jgi:hypothetical protein
VALGPKTEFVRKEFVRSGKPRPLKDSEKQLTFHTVICARSWGQKLKYFSSSANGIVSQLRNAARKKP